MLVARALDWFSGACRDWLRLGGGFCHLAFDRGHHFGFRRTLCVRRSLLDMRLDRYTVLARRFRGDSFRLDTLFDVLGMRKVGSAAATSDRAFR